MVGDLGWFLVAWLAVFVVDLVLLLVLVCFSDLVCFSGLWVDCCLLILVVI